ncbi:MAG: ribonuclease J [Armatimonadetes bacterium]|nr:ribonuclease J [Armatimonadota bacterium]
MTDPVRLISLGGTLKIGKNMLVFEQRGELLLVDCGMGFPDETLPGVDLILPDMTYVFENRDRVVGLILTHGHEDHIGAAPYLLERMPVDIYGTPLTLGLLNSKLEEFHAAPGMTQTPVQASETRQIGSFTVEFIRVSHSIPDGLALGLRTDAGLIVHTSDFKFDYTPADGQLTDLHRFSALGAEDVLLLLTDCTNAEKAGQTPSERQVTAALRELIHDAPGRVIVTTFASNISRMQQVIDVSGECARKIAIEGRSMVRIAETARELGYLKVPDGMLLPIEVIDELPREHVTILTTGSQGEPMSALSRIAEGRHKHVCVEEGDMVIISASPIPGNETLISSAINSLLSQGARVVHGPAHQVHVSGHASREELKMMLTLVRPKYVVPTHGELRHMVAYRELAVEMGLPRDRVLLLSPGDVVELQDGEARFGETVPAGSINVDGLGVGDVGEVVIRDRRDLSRDGIFLPVVVVDAETFEPLAPIEAYSRGFVHMRDAQEIVDEANARALQAVRDFQAEGVRDIEVLKARVKAAVRKYLYAITERRPIILPIVTPIGDLPPEESPDPAAQ